MNESTLDRDQERTALDKLFDLVDQINWTNIADLCYEVEKLRGYHDALFRFYAPFQVGDRVVLHHDYEIGTESGWRGRTGMMQTGAKAVVKEVDWSRGDFTISVEFDCEFLDPRPGLTDLEVPLERRHIFTFRDPECFWSRI